MSIFVTQVIDILDKPALVKWANDLGLNNISLDDYYRESKTKGTNTHKDIEDYLKTGKEFPDQEKLKKLLKGYEVVGVEHVVDNGFLRGRIDLVLKKDGETFIVDYKGRGRIYLKDKLQFSTYKEMINANHICIIDYTKWEMIKLNLNTERYFEMVKHLYKIKYIMNTLNEKL